MIFSFKKRKEKENLINTPVLIKDTSANSSDYFVINNYPLEFTSGKNAIRLFGSDKFQPGSEFLVEVLDGSGQNIYTEVNNFKDQHNNFVVSALVYDDTHAGAGSLTILGVLKKDASGKSIPDEWKGKYNIKWTVPITISPTKRNDSEILLSTPPTIDLALIVLPYNEIVTTEDSSSYNVTSEYTQYLFQSLGMHGGNSTEYTYDIPQQTDIYNPREGFSRVSLTANITPISKTTNTVDGTITKLHRDVYNGVQMQDLAAYNNIIYIASSSVTVSLYDGTAFNYTGGFTDNMIGAKFQAFQFGTRGPLTASGLTVDTQNTDEIYTTTVVDILDSRTLLLQEPYKPTYRTTLANGSSKLVEHRYNSFTNTSASITYKTPPTYITSSIISQSLINFTFRNLAPIAGDIYRIKTYQKNHGRLGEYQVIKDSIVTPPEILVDKNILNDKAYINSDFKWYGNLTIDNVNSYWTLITDIGTTFSQVTTNLQNYTASIPQLTSFIVDKDRYESLNSISLDSILLGTAESEFYKADQTYRLTFKLTADFNTTSTVLDECEIEVYASSEQVLGAGYPAIARAFNPTTNIDKATQLGLDSRYGKMIGRVKSAKGSGRYKSYSKLAFEFKADHDGIGRILFRVKKGAYHISEVHTTPAVYNGFTPNYLNYTVPLEVGDTTSLGITTESQSVDFKFEYFDYLGRQSDYVSYIGNVHINELAALPSLGCNRPIITITGELPDAGPFPTAIMFSSFSTGSSVLGSVYPGGYPDTVINAVSTVLNSNIIGTYNYPSAFGWNYQRYSGSYYSGSLQPGIFTTETFGGVGLNATPELQPFSSNWLHSSSWFEGYQPDIAIPGTCACIAKRVVSESWKKFDDLGSIYSPAAERIEANTYLKQTRLYWPATTGSTTAARNQYTPFVTNGGIYKVRFKLTQIAGTKEGSAANVYANHSWNTITQFEPSSGGTLNVYIYDVGAGAVGSGTRAGLLPGIASWYPYDNNIFKVNYADIIASYPLTSSYIQYETYLVQWGLNGRLVFEASGSAGGFFGGCIDDVEVCQVGVTTDPLFIAPPAYIYEDTRLIWSTPGNPILTRGGR